MSSLFLLLSFIGIVLVALWSIEQEKLPAEERGYSGWFGLKRPSTLPPEAPRKKSPLDFRKRDRNAAPIAAAPERLKDEELAALFRRTPTKGE
jgi:hypothetical protein